MILKYNNLIINKIVGTVTVKKDVAVKHGKPVRWDEDWGFWRLQATKYGFVTELSPLTLSDLYRHKKSFVEPVLKSKYRYCTRQSAKHVFDKISPMRFRAPPLSSLELYCVGYSTLTVNLNSKCFCVALIFTYFILLTRNV